MCSVAPPLCGGLLHTAACAAIEVSIFKRGGVAGKKAGVFWRFFAVLAAGISCKKSVVCGGAFCFGVFFGKTFFAWCFPWRRGGVGQAVARLCATGKPASFVAVRLVCMPFLPRCSCPLQCPRVVVARCICGIGKSPVGGSVLRGGCSTRQRRARCGVAFTAPPQQARVPVLQALPPCKATKKHVQNVQCLFLCNTYNAPCGLAPLLSYCV